MANPLKGEIDIELSGKSYRCRLTVDSIIRIEDELDASIIELAIKISQAKAKMKELATVLKYALRNGGNDIDDNEVKKLIFDNGIDALSTIVANIITLTLSDPSEKSKGKPQAVAQK